MRAAFVVGALGLLACGVLRPFVSPAKAADPAPKFEIDRVQIESQPGWFVLKIPTQATWAHWTLANPPRIILDFADALSVLPNAPALYEVELDRGPVRIFRTSQFANNPLDRRVRMTLELSKITPYEARRVGNEIHVLVEAANLKAPTAIVTAEGLHLEGAGERIESLTAAAADAFEKPEAAAKPDSEARSESEPVPAVAKARAGDNKNTADTAQATHTDDADAGATNPADKADKAGRADKADTVEDSSEDSAEAILERGIEDIADILAGVHSKKSRDEASKDSGEHSAESAPPSDTENPGQGPDDDIADDIADEIDAADDQWRSDPGVLATRETPAVAIDSTETTSTEPHGDVATGPADGAESQDSGSEDPDSEDLPSANEDTADPALADNTEPAGKSEKHKLESMRETLEELLGENNVENITETPDGDVLNDEELNDRLLAEEEFEDWKDFDEEDPLEPADSLRARRARHLLEAAIEDWLVNDIDGAERRAERCFRYYGDYPAGLQAGLLLHEIYMTTDRAGKTASLYLMGELPNTKYLGLEFFEKLLAIYFDNGDRESVLERMDKWGHLYEDTGWSARYHYAFGREDFLARKARSAEEHLKQVSPDDPGGAEALLMRARLADEDKRGLEALALYRELARDVTGPFSLRGLARSADLEFQHGEIDASLDAYEEILAVDAPKDEKIWAQYQIGNCHFIKGRVEEARHAYEELIEQHPEAFWTRFARERLGSLGWESDVASRIEELKNP